LYQSLLADAGNGVSLTKLMEQVRVVSLMLGGWWPSFTSRLCHVAGYHRLGTVLRAVLRVVHVAIQRHDTRARRPRSNNLRLGNSNSRWASQHHIRASIVPCLPLPLAASWLQNANLILARLVRWLDTLGSHRIRSGRERYVSHVSLSCESMLCASMCASLIRVGLWWVVLQALVAVQFVINYEEGGENCILLGDEGSEWLLSDIVGAAPYKGQRHMNMETLYGIGCARARARAFVCVLRCVMHARVWRCTYERTPSVCFLSFGSFRYEYGSRAGFWRLLQVFTQHQLPATVFAVAKALEANPAAATVSGVCACGVWGYDC